MESLPDELSGRNLFSQYSRFIGKDPVFKLAGISMSGGDINLSATGITDVIQGYLTVDITSCVVSLGGEVITDITIQRKQNKNHNQ